MWTHVVIIESVTRTHGLESWLHNGADDIIQIALTSQRSLDDVKGGSAVEMKTYPHLHGTTSIAGDLTNGDVNKSFSWSAPDTSPAIIE